ncbi:MAG TPA: LysR family transcriptional regulator [Polyangiaceae bacterium]|nr:LysR family transcriptional regulator [Polyangiaceae bacterium]
MSGALETRDLRLVRAIAESGGATQAARQLHLSQSAVSHQLRGLEERLGLPLFERKGRRLEITAAGQRLVELAHQVLLPLLQTELELKRGLLRERPKLRVSAQCYTAYHWLPQALVALMAEHPDVELVLQTELTGDADEQLREDRSDLVLCVTPPRRGAHVQVPLFEDELVLAVPRGHALARRAFVEGKDLARETLIQNDVSAAERERVRKLLFKPGQGVKHVLRLPATEAVLDLVQAGLGVSILAGFTIRSRVARGELSPVRLTRRGLPRSWTGVFRKRSALEAPIRTLLGTLKRHGLPE